MRRQRSSSPHLKERPASARVRTSEPPMLPMSKCGIDPIQLIYFLICCLPPVSAAYVHMLSGLIILYHGRKHYEP